ncbi:WhiB family transcriptional regulator, partial [Pseudonocardia bannensis]|nr:WhiB family transcriptional regulator [Pseudonocardia bannensis]
MTAAHDIARDWRADALCAQVDPELFFPAAERGALYEAQVAAAKGVCAGCPVRVRCLEYALAALSDGIAGGTTPDERSALRGRAGLGEPAEGLVELMPPGGQRDRTAAGRAAAAAGLGVTELMRRFGVARGTAQRWCAGARRVARTTSTTAAASVVGEGSPAATGT